jgi:hypothetical protein
LVGFAALQLFRRLRFLEMYDSELLLRFETFHKGDGFVVVHGRRPHLDNVPEKGMARFRAYRVWSGVLIAFLALAAFGVVISTQKMFPELLPMVPQLGTWVPQTPSDNSN